jgi:hypothetical protein
VALGLAITLVVSCGNSDAKRKGKNYVAAGEGGGSGGAGEAPAVAGGVGGVPEMTAGTGGSPEVPMGGAAGQVGQVAEGGMAGAAPALVETVVSSDVNLSTDSLSTGRDCGEAIAYSVTAISASTVTLAEAPDAACLTADDEVLLINLQGTPAENNKVGHWELLHVADITGTTVTVTGAVKRLYGTGTSNAGLGTADTEQRVALVRVPRFERLVVAEGAHLTANAWDGVLGGVLALRATELDVSGTIDVAALGYRGGQWSQDDVTCSNSLQTQAGESIGGLGAFTTSRNLGASGGIGPGATSFNSDNVSVSTPGHSQAGEFGFNPKGRTIGEVGSAYGAADATKLTLGSGPGGGLNCINTPINSGPNLVDTGTTGQGGGIALLLVDDVQVQAMGAITASPPDEARNIAFAGGYVFIRGATLSLGTNQVTALGSVGRQPNGPTAGQTNQASPGYIVLSATTVTGTTNPPALTAADSPAPGL